MMNSTANTREDSLKAELRAKEPMTAKVELTKMIRTICFIMVLFFGSVGLAKNTGTDGAAPRGLSIQNGVFYHEGRPVRAIGANYMSLFSRILENPNDESSLRGLEQLSKAGIPFVRFMACGFWPVDWELYLKDPDRYFRQLDKVVQTAEKQHVGLIPSLFWNFPAIPDLAAEPMDQFANPGSKTSDLVRKYTGQVVTRYKDSPAVWGWEFCNEFNLQVDLPNAAEHRPAVWPALKTAGTRSERDDLTSAHMAAVFELFVKAVRAIDDHRPVFTGNAIPRGNAWHNTVEKSWAADSPEQFRQILLRDNPDSFGTLCVHIYPDKDNSYPGGYKTINGLIQAIQEVARDTKRPLFIGEFGAAMPAGDKEAVGKFLEILHAVETCQVPLAAFWVFDFPPQEKDYNVSFTNDRAFLMEQIDQANRKMRAAACGGEKENRRE
jgi:hypothetical protein